jgi:thymidylate synthase
MKQYIELVQHVLDTGTRKENRTGIDTISTFNHNFEVDLKYGFPLLTTKSVSWKNIVVELLWFLSGQTDISILKRHGCKFWDAWADSSGQVPSAYGNFWRHFPIHGTIDSSDHNIDGMDVCKFNDQIAWVLAELKKNPMSRRMVVSAWAPGNAQYSKLPPCHCLFMLNVQNEELTRGEAYCKRCYRKSPAESMHCTHCKVREDTLTEGHYPRLCLHLTQRSCDVALGVPYNIASYALLLSLFSHFTGIEPGIFAHTLVDAHIYTAKPDGSKAEFDHVPGLKEQIARSPLALPKLRISEEIKSLEDIEKLMAPEVTTDEVMKHFVLEGYDPHEAIAFRVAV